MKSSFAVRPHRITILRSTSRILLWIAALVTMIFGSGPTVLAQTPEANAAKNLCISALNEKRADWESTCRRASSLATDFAGNAILASAYRFKKDNVRALAEADQLVSRYPKEFSAYRFRLELRTEAMMIVPAMDDGIRAIALVPTDQSSAKAKLDAKEGVESLVKKPMADVSSRLAGKDGNCMDPNRGYEYAAKLRDGEDMNSYRASLRQDLITCLGRRRVELDRAEHSSKIIQAFIRGCAAAEIAEVKEICARQRPSAVRIQNDYEAQRALAARTPDDALVNAMDQAQQTAFAANVAEHYSDAVEDFTVKNVRDWSERIRTGSFPTFEQQCGRLRVSPPANHAEVAAMQAEAQRNIASYKAGGAMSGTNRHGRYYGCLVGIQGAEDIMDERSTISAIAKLEELDGIQQAYSGYICTRVKTKACVSDGLYASMTARFSDSIRIRAAQLLKVRSEASDAAEVDRKAFEDAMKRY